MLSIKSILVDSWTFPTLWFFAKIFVSEERVAEENEKAKAYKRLESHKTGELYLAGISRCYASQLLSPESTRHSPIYRAAYVKHM